MGINRKEIEKESFLSNLATTSGRWWLRRPRTTAGGLKRHRVAWWPLPASTPVLVGGGLSGLRAASHSHLRPRGGRPNVGQCLTGQRMAGRSQSWLAAPLPLGAKQCQGHEMPWVGHLSLGLGISCPTRRKDQQTQPKRPTRARSPAQVQVRPGPRPDSSSGWTRTATHTDWVGPGPMGQRVNPI
ncbi:hypothetical protein CJ030_MR0G013382 [Morella rubra]|uniref:Uncharacterized protein n=1 Tax=Morella rubra TaxID=262757 RepID=A0A6A1UH61_9ROSI|nr:hypothetical protein CJ030_MR0G013380 [Morella rubra]KAB1199785.1 hypothetical protein CJ030_MR0G013382 [Morella rubra]